MATQGRRPPKRTGNPARTAGSQEPGSPKAGSQKSGGQKAGGQKSGSQKSGSQKNAAQKNGDRSKNAPRRTGKKDVRVFDTPAPVPEEPRVFRLAVVPGATPGKWIDAWKQRMPHVALELIPVAAGDAHRALSEVDAALVRLPITDDALHVIALYDELPVVVAAADSHLLAVDELTIDDLAGEVVITPSDTVFGPFALPGTTPATFAPLPTADAIVTAASGVGVVIVPMSLARLHHRKDAGHRPLRDGPTSTVALVWPRERTTPDVETFVGIVRGRTANSSR